MSYQHTTAAQLKTLLAARLDDSGKLFWTDTELGFNLRESLWLYGLLTGWWKARKQFVTEADEPWYNLNTVNSDYSTILAPSVLNDRLVMEMQRHTLETVTDGTTHTGTDQFSYSLYTTALQHRRDRFLSDTGLILTRSSQATGSPPVEEISLAATVIDIRRLVWQTPTAYKYLFRETELGATGLNPSWYTTEGVPIAYAYSLAAPPPLTARIIPVCSDSGTVHLLTINTGATLTSSGAVVGVPDLFSSFVKWGAMADILSAESPAKDPERALWCEEMYSLGVWLSETVPTVLNILLNGRAVIPGTLVELDRYCPDWESTTPAAPTQIGLSGNQMALYPTPNDVYSVLCDLVYPAPFPADSAYVQVGQEHLGPVLDWAEHISRFKLGWAEFSESIPKAKSFLEFCFRQNGRIAPLATDIPFMRQTSRREETDNPRSSHRSGIGALTSNPTGD